jgi:DNA-binding GntR family transcriptional regulator
VTIDPDLPVPAYRQLAAILRGRIAAGELKGRLPGEVTLQQTYGVGRNTVRAAIGVLKEEGLLVTVAGLGTYVLAAD